MRNKDLTFRRRNC